MDYNTLPLEERMKHAENYAMILKDEVKLPEQIINELSTIFVLTKEQASQAYFNSKANNSAEFKRADKRKFSQLIVSSIVLAGCGFLYFMMASENGLGFFVVISFLCGLALIGTAIFAIKYFFGSLAPRFRWLKNLERNPFVKALPYTLAIFCWLGYRFFWGEVLLEKNMTKLDLKLDQDVELRKLKTKGSTTYYYYFHFNGYQKEFRLNESELSFSSQDVNFLKKLKGDSIHLYVATEEMPKFHEVNMFNRFNRITNIIENNTAIIDFNERNITFEEQRKTYFTYAMLILTAHLLIIGFVITDAKKKYVA